MIAAAFVSGGLLAGLWFTSRLRRLPAARTEQPPSISVVIPARDEAGNLPALLGSLAASASDVHEIVVVDDASTDGTAEVASAHGATVVRVDGPPPGWAGKPYACARGAESSTGELIVFLDADVRLLPGAIPRLAAAHAERGGLVSVQPYHRMQRPHEELSAMFNVVSVLGSGAFARWPPPSRAVAFGPCLVTSRRDYLAVGGHAAVRGDVVEDMALARAYQRAGMAVDCRVGSGAIEFRMYPDGVAQLVEGWTKNIAAGAGSTDRRGMIAGIWFVAACATAFAAALSVGVRIGSAGRAEVVTAVAMWAAVTAVLHSVLRRIGSFRWSTAVFHPIATCAFVAVFARSLWSTVVRRQVRWRGRDIALRRVRAD